MKLYFIRHKPSGLYIPHSTLTSGNRSTGGSKVAPDNPAFARPFRSRHAANAFLRQWLLGVHSYRSDYFGEVDFKITPDASRRKDEMEIIEKEIDLA